MSEINSNQEIILIIDQDVNGALQLEKILQKFNYKVKVYTSADDLEKIIQTVKPIIVLFDFNTCFKKNNYALTTLNKIQENLLSMVVIDNKDVDSAKKLFSDGIYDFINKPYRVENILIRVKHCIDEAKLRLEKIKIEKALDTSEKRYIRTIRGTNDGMWDWDINTGEIFFSNRWKEMLGYTDLNIDFPSNYNEWRSLIHPDDSGKSLISCLNLLDGFSNSIDFEYRILTKKNNYKWIHIRAMASYDRSGKIEFISGSHSDITEKKQTLFEHQRMENQLRQSHKMKALGQLTGGIAHDFNNILASILGYAELSKEFLMLSNEQKLVSYQDEILQAGIRARDLISQLLIYSRDGGGNISTVSLKPLVKEVVKLLKSSFPTTIDITLNIEDDLPSILVDPIQIEQILMNHCLNSKESMDGRGKIKISLTYEMIDSNHELICKSCHEIFKGGYVVFTINDTGKGIDSKSLNKIFDPYVTTKEFGDGPGMGLSVIHGIVHQHNGHIRVQSTVGKGASFELYFPAKKNVNAVETKIEKIPFVENAYTVKILIVDDEKSIADYLGEYLKLHGYQTTVLTNSIEALALVKSDPKQFELLITDLTMPNLTGIELAQECSKYSKNMSVIICSGNNELIKNPDYEISIIKDVISKPFVGSQLLSTVAAVLK